MAELKLEFDRFFEPILDKAVIRNNIDFQKGIYFWFVNEASLNRLNIPINSNLHWVYRNNQTLYLIYIGIGPSNQNVRRQFLKDRITKCHLGKHINQSTLRQSISALLEHRPYNKMVGQNMKIFIEKDLESEITDFISNGFSLGVLGHDEPWSIEGEFIHNYNPPINLSGNQNGWFYNEMSLRRATHRAIGAEDIRES